MLLSPKQKYYIDFLLALTQKEIKARYKFAVFGFLWVVLNPLIQMLVMGFVFQFFVPVRVSNYFLFLLVGLLPWNFFSMTLARNTALMVNERTLIQKAKFPRETLILSIVLSNLFHFGIAFILLLLALIGDKILEGYSLSRLLFYTVRILSSLPLCLWLGVLVSGFSLLFSALNVKYRDINLVVQAMIPLWFYATPIVYNLTLLPPQIRWLFILNPLTSIIEIFQFLLLNQPFASSPLFIGLNLLFGLIITIIGCVVFYTESPFFDDWV
jgi:lipopolysaccharide transport system permease protein